MVRVMSRSARGDRGARGEPWRPTRPGPEEADRQLYQSLRQAITPWYRAGSANEGETRLLSVGGARRPKSHRGPVRADRARLRRPQSRGCPGRSLCPVDRGPLSGPRVRLQIFVLDRVHVGDECMRRVKRGGQGESGNHSPTGAWGSGFERPVVVRSRT